MADEYTIDIPGATDIFRLPIHEGYPTLSQYKAQGKTRADYLKDVPEHIRQLRKERSTRFASKKTPLPTVLQKIPTIINHIDDVQDILTTALTLAKPLLRKLPGRFIPVLGWVLLANDIMNLSVALLSTPLTGGNAKAMARATYRRYARGKVAKLGRVPAFLGKTKWLPFALQAGQAAETLTGYGLRLGGVMGMVSDSIWGGIRKLSGDKVIFRGPPPSDPLGKAYRVLSQAPQQAYYQDILSPYEEALIMAGNNIAIQIIQDAGEKSKVEEMNDTVATAKPLIFYPWDEESLEGLSEADLLIPPEEVQSVTTLDDTADYVDIIRDSAEHETEWQLHRKAQYAPCDGGIIHQQMHSQAGEAVWEMLTDAPEVVQNIPSTAENVIIKTIEWGILPKYNLNPKQIRYYIERAISIVEAQGENWPFGVWLEQAATEAKSQNL